MLWRRIRFAFLSGSCCCRRASLTRLQQIGSENCRLDWATTPCKKKKKKKKKKEKKKKKKGKKEKEEEEKEKEKEKEEICSIILQFLVLRKICSFFFSYAAFGEPSTLDIGANCKIKVSREPHVDEGVENVSLFSSLTLIHR